MSKTRPITSKSSPYESKSNQSQVHSRQIEAKDKSIRVKVKPKSSTQVKVKTKCSQLKSKSSQSPAHTVHSCRNQVRSSQIRKCVSVHVPSSRVDSNKTWVTERGHRESVFSLLIIFHYTQNSAKPAKYNNHLILICRFLNHIILT